MNLTNMCCDGWLHNPPISSLAISIEHSQVPKDSLVDQEKRVTIYLTSRQQRALNHGQPGMFQRLGRVFQTAGWRFDVRPEAERHQMADMPGYHLVVNRDCTSPFCLNLRNAYLPDFWRIEDSNDRWNFSVADRKFEPDLINRRRAAEFIERWRPKAMRMPSRDGFIFIPLQGVLRRKRHFQVMSPIDMIKTTLAADPHRPVTATLHPRETYNEDDLTALAKIIAEEPRFFLSREHSEDLVRRCDYVVTENSGLAFIGSFAEKPAVLFAQIDFHHIARPVSALGVEAAFDGIGDYRPDFSRYLVWFLRWQAIAYFADDAEERIVARLREHHWPI